jgi:hypothetical protein
MIKRQSERLVSKLTFKLGTPQTQVWNATTWAFLSGRWLGMTSLANMWKKMAPFCSLSFTVLISLYILQVPQDLSTLILGEFCVS